MQDAPENTIGLVLERRKLIHRDTSSQVRPKCLAPRFDVQAYRRCPARRGKLDVTQALTFRESEMHLNRDALLQQKLLSRDFA